jgi:hypothetical protein
MWTGKEFSPFGYGRTFVRKRTRTNAHRMAWLLYRGPIPPGLCVLHRCDVPACVNPDHLFLGTPQDNVRDMMAKGRGKYLHGEAHHNSKLTDRDWFLALELYLWGWTTEKIGAFFGVTRHTIETHMRRAGFQRIRPGRWRKAA